MGSLATTCTKVSCLGTHVVETVIERISIHADVIINNLIIFAIQLPWLISAAFVTN